MNIFLNKVPFSFQYELLFTFHLRCFSTLIPFSQSLSRIIYLVFSFDILSLLLLYQPTRYRIILFYEKRLGCFFQLVLKFGGSIIFFDVALASKILFFLYFLLNYFPSLPWGSDIRGYSALEIPFPIKSERRIFYLINLLTYLWKMAQISKTLNQSLEDPEIWSDLIILRKYMRNLSEKELWLSDKEFSRAAK